MTDAGYDDAVNEALERLVHAGYFFGTGSEFRGFAIHAPMGAETLATLGYYDQVPGWVDWYKAGRNVGPLPPTLTALDSGDESSWRPALGEVRRLTDWAVLFGHQIDELGWRETLAVWWPRLSPGMMAGLTHGLIRTAHAIRVVAAVDSPSALELTELARGLAFWAGMYQPPDSAMARGAKVIGTIKTLGRQSTSSLYATADELAATSVDAALTELAVIGAGRYATLPPGGNPVAPVHTVTAPAALRMVLPHLPADQALPSYEHVRDVCGDLTRLFMSRAKDAPVSAPVDGDDPAVRQRIIEEAVELRDEHAIKISEAARREYAAKPDPRFFVAAHHAHNLLRGSNIARLARNR